MHKRQVLANAVMSLAQAAAAGAILFLLYRFIIRTLGAEQLGIWSVVSAAASTTRVADFGLSGSVVKFVARYAARGEEERVAGVMQTALISIGVLAGLILLVAYPFLRRALGVIFAPDTLPVALSILPYSVFSLWVTLVTGVLQGGLEGRQRIDIRSSLLIGSYLFNLFLCFWLTPRYGVMGLAYAQAIQAVALLIAAWLLLRRYIPALGLVPRRWDKKLFSEMAGYGVNFQAASAAQMLYEPVTKALLARFGGLTMAAYYEMASRIVTQLRALIMCANQVLVPTIADLQEKNVAAIQSVYKSSYRLLTYFAVPLYSAIIVCAPLASHVLFGRYEAPFVVFSVVLSLGWFINTLCGPSYFANMGTGELKWNTIGHAAIGILNIGLGLIFGSRYGGTAVIFASAVSLAAGSILIPLSYHRRHAIILKELFPKPTVGIMAAAAAGTAISMALYYALNGLWPYPGIAVLMLGVFSAILAIPVWQHPVRRQVFKLLAHDLLGGVSFAQTAGGDRWA